MVICVPEGTGAGVAPLVPPSVGGGVVGVVGVVGVEGSAGVVVPGFDVSAGVVLPGV
ncbi:hypothetical protein [Noviherbaspirillum sp.]|uniref:hypothetical protein n=1 Tax=Noviherbaspirillum sp. TaxID=1926288 RepID=UPI002B4A6E0A|nr:hypothetical protein [Noviherbaspirillum sp.]HJV82876.1 hypothetical protein [Noviherbaspirillum sp.]